MEVAFRMRLRKGEGVSKKGPLIAKQTFSTSTSSSANTTTPSSSCPSPNTSAVTPSKEIRPTICGGPLSLTSHRRRPLSPDPRTQRRGLRDSPASSPKSSPKTSPSRHQGRDRSNSPVGSGASRRMGALTGGRSQNFASIGSRKGPRNSPSTPPLKRVTPPTSPRVRRPLSPLRKLSTPIKVVSITSSDVSAAPVAKPRTTALKCLASPTRPRSPNVLTTMKHPKSPNSTRPSSPQHSAGSSSPRGTSPRGRGASPGSRVPPISEEVLKARVQKALKARLYLLHQPGPNSFSIGGDSPSHKYKVIIGPQTCSCGHGPYCIHILFVMVRVLQISESDPLLIACSLKDYEVEQLLRSWEERRKRAIRTRENRTMNDSKDKFFDKRSLKGGKACPSSPSGSHMCLNESSSGEEDAQCPICLMMMVEGESLVACEAGCRNFLHHHCMAVWAADRYAQGQVLLCPLCRAPWPSKSQPRLGPRKSPSAFSSHSKYPVMSASFSGICNTTRQSPTSSPVMSRSLSSYSNRPGSVSTPADSAYSSPSLGRSPVFGYPPTVKGELSASVVRNAVEEIVPLPRSDPIPSEHEETAATWVSIFGRELIACLFSRDWAVRETGLRRLAHDVVKVLRWERLVTTEQMQIKMIHCCAHILAQVANDPVYKVYLACLRCVRVLLSHLCPTEGSEVIVLQQLFRPLIHTLLLKCADGNRRTSQISVDLIIELCRGQRGELALATQSSGIHATPGLGGISYVLSSILEDSPPTEAPWQWLLGRLSVLDRLLDEFPHQFQLQTVELTSTESGYKLQHYDRLMTVVEFAFKALGSNHATVSKLARRIYICGARMAACEPAVFNQVCDMLAKLDVSLQMRLKRRLRSMQGSHGDRRGSASRLAIDTKLSSPTTDFLSGSPRLVRSVSHSPSRMFSALRPASPVKPNILKSSFKPDVESVPKVPLRRPNHLPLDSFDVKFKEKQARLRIYHNARAKQELIAQQALISPQNLDKWVPKKPFKLKGTFSHSHGDNLDLSPKTQKASVSPFLPREVTSTPATPSAPYSTPAKEILIDKFNHLDFHDLTELPLPLIPGLELVPKYLESSFDPNKQVAENSQYEEGKDWMKGPLLGTGAFSSCYQARDVRTGIIMAAKQLSICRNSEEDQERVEAAVEEEIILMSKLSHSNIVRLLGATRISTSFSVFSEWMAGGSVSGMLEKYGAFSEQVIIKYTKQVLGGLAYLHDNKILHRDLKGANLLVDSTGQLLRIGDFGTAAKLATKSTVTGEFQGQLLGTIAFMAPEVLRGDNYGRACDVWSVGCCIIEMATTKPPWGVDNVSNQYKLMFRIATSSGPPVIPENMYEPIRDVTLQCLQISSEMRPQAKELLRHSVFHTQPP